MTIKTSTDLVRYIRHHVAGSEWQDVKAVEDFVQERQQPLVEALKRISQMDSPNYERKIIPGECKDVCDQALAKINE